MEGFQNMSKRFFSLAAAAVLFASSPVLGEVNDTVGSNAPAVPDAGEAPTIWEGASSVLYDNGSLITHTGGGCGGYDDSRLQDALAMSTFGFGHQLTSNFRVADDFTVADANGWELTQATFFAYQTGSTTTSTITAVNAQIWDGVPAAGGTVVCGDAVTNCQTATAFSGIYRELGSTPGACNRPIMAQTCSFAGCVLPPGTYWIDWQTDGSLGSGPWAPPVTINGSTSTGDGLQSLAGTAGPYAPAIDIGVGLAQGFPFILEGTVVSGSLLEIPTLAPVGLALFAAGLGAVAAVRLRRRSRK